MQTELDSALLRVETRLRVIGRAWGLKDADFEAIRAKHTGPMSRAVVMVSKHPEIQAEAVDLAARDVLAAAGYLPPQRKQVG